MSKALDKAVAKVKTLSPKRQRDAARVLEDMAAAGDDGVYELTEAEAQLVDEGLAELRKGLVASDEDVQTVFDKYR